MADDKSKVKDKAGEIAKNIWLAGVGAYGKAVDEAQGRMEKAGVEPPKLFRELVKAGAALEEEARGALEAGHAARNSVEERIQRARDNFNLQRPVRGEDLLALHAKIDRLNDRLEALTEALSEATGAGKSRTGKAGAKSAAKAAPRKRAAGKKTPAAKKAGSSKSAGKSAPSSRNAATTPRKKAATRRKSR